MPLTKEQVRTKRRGTEDPNDVQFDHPPQKKRHLPNGFPRFIKDLSYGLKKGLGEKKYVSIFPRRKLRSLLLELGSEWWEEDEEPNWKEIYNAQEKIARDKLPLAPEKLKKKSKSVQVPLT